MSEEENLALFKRNTNRYVADYVRSIAERFDKELGNLNTIPTVAVIGWLKEYANEVEDGRG